MSLSQKHYGKVLVPWFNTAEWKAVYNLIYSETGQDWPKALSILKIWKLRTPLLSSGVEGTLIVLEALLVNTNLLSSYETSHIFCTSLVRFLNLCAANSAKQGTFYKTAIKNDLPKWLIGLRHDIAHSHNVPPLSMLELGLKFCLGWLKGKYWDVQCDNMADFVVEKATGNGIEDAFYILENLGENGVHENIKLMKKINNFVGEAQKQTSCKKMQEYVLNRLRKEITTNKEASVGALCKLLIDDLTILSIQIEIDESGVKRIPPDYLNKWNKLFGGMYEAQIMPDFIYKLFNFVCDDRNDLLHREVASLWIKEIFLALINQQNNDKNIAVLSFSSHNNSLKDKHLVTEVLERLTPFTPNFAREVLIYNNAPVELIEDSLCLMSAFDTHSATTNGKIFTVDDLDLIEETFNDVRDVPTQSKSRWTLIEDTSLFLNLPLGVLPHQDRNKSPLLDV
ncbi:uncharacterized protein LOC100142009 [Tribolium castaneum]|uniref:Uncharacterized protein n=1 Tax=Tribolium castaneum TaxID=7070 RepID=D6WHS5_TRICA|nr:PREDICTED: uncharacterized protein LOC100142009 [Tribolium castaneum]EFA00066.1 hypothetical protein TcasGA2_TC002880 [Tribolium castaneum]|eukprot:XP_001808147.1 PREDICTED: uncharacterized protein LOC100142009 [Tribolium castaneum]